MDDFMVWLFVVVATLALGFVVGLLFGLLFGWVVMLLWNWLMPTIFGLTTITYWQGVGLLWLSAMLFKGSITAQSKS